MWKPLSWLFSVVKFSTAPVMSRIFALRTPAQLESERKRAEEALAQQSAVIGEQTALLDLAFDAIVVRSLDHIVTFWNQGAERMYGWTKAEALGRDKRALLQTQFPQPIAEIDAEVLRSGYWEGELVHATKSGTQLVIGSRWALERDERGQPKAILEINRDITARKLAEEASRRAHDDLEQRVAERTAELSRVNLAKEVLLKEIHHRVKNNLQVISSLLSLQARTLHDSATIAMLHESQQRIQSMALIHEKLYQSQDYTRVHFAEYIRSLVLELFRAYRVNTGAIRLQTEVEDLFLTMDLAIPCGLILNELLSNCLKHAFPGECKGAIHITFRLEQGHYLLTMRDNGVGLPPNVDFLTSRTFGLRLIRTLVSQLEGAIQLNRDAGTAFELRFPAESRQPSLAPKDLAPPADLTTFNS